MTTSQGNGYGTQSIETSRAAAIFFFFFFFFCWEENIVQLIFMDSPGSTMLVFSMASWQYSKLRVHPAPCVHILAAGCTDFSTCAPGVCMLFLTY